jgi:Sigma-70 factor, region 1.1
MISTTAVDHLMQLGRRRGGLHIDDIRQVLPVDTMTIEELADVLARLEEAGIAFEIDAGMLTPHHRKMTLPGVNPMKEPMRHNEPAMTAHVTQLGLASSMKAAAENSHRTREPARTYVKKSGTIFVVAAALILLLLALVVWRFT